jgi:hypothetical protein
MGTFTFTGMAMEVTPDARDFAASVIEASTVNTLDTVTNSVNFAGDVTVTIVTPPAQGTASVNGNQTINYDATGAAGQQTIVYQATDGVDTDQGTITITVAANALPVAPNGNINISTQGAAPGAGTAGNVNVSNLAGYAAGNTPSSVAITTPPNAAKGTASVMGATIQFIPAAAFFTGTDTIGYTITDSNGDTDTGVITVTIADVNPALSDGSITADQSGASPALPLGITPGNGSVAQHTLAVSTQAASGNCNISGTSLTYTPVAGYFGPDSCVVTITDGDGDTDTGTISINVVNVGATDDEFVVLRSYCCYANFQVLANDFGFGNPVTVTITSAPDRGGSAYVGNSPGPKSGIYIEYYANGGGISGEYLERFTYRVTDGIFTDTAIVTVRVVDFIAQDDSATTIVDSPVTINVGANDLGFAYPATVGIFLSAAHGSLTVNGSPGSPSALTISYQPNPAFRGRDTFQYAMDDGTRVGFATVTIDVIDDADRDGIADGADNCIEVSNHDQRDSNGDGYGNACDADLNQDGRVNFADLAMFRQRFSTNDPHADFDGNGAVNFGDLARFRSLFGKPPGPSALHP